MNSERQTEKLSQVKDVKKKKKNKAKYNVWFQIGSWLREKIL